MAHLAEPRGAGVRRQLRTPARRRAILAATAFLAPFMILLVGLQYFPLGVLVRDSFYRFSLFNPEKARFVGLKNYQKVFADPDTLQSLFVSLLFIVGFLVLVLPIGFVLAVFLNQARRGRSLARVFVFLPVVTSQVVVATLWTFMLSRDGLANAVLGAVNTGPISFLSDSRYALPTLVAVTVWQQVGLCTIIFLGGLQAIPRELVEAASLDGASAARRMWSITVPLLARTTGVTTIVMTVFALQAFAPAYIMTGGAPDGTTNLIVYHMYKTAFLIKDPGFASAISAVVLVVALAISLSQSRILRPKWSY